MRTSLLAIRQIVRTAISAWRKSVRIHALAILATCCAQTESGSVGKQQQQCSVGNVSNISQGQSQGHSDNPADECAATQQKVDKSYVSYESVVPSSSYPVT